MKKLIHTFLNWWKDAPFYLSVWFIPVVIALYIIAFIKNLITGESKA